VHNFGRRKTPTALTVPDDPSMIPSSMGRTREEAEVMDGGCWMLDDGAGDDGALV